MDKAKLLIKELAEVTGTDVELDESGICELEADGNLLVLRYREARKDWLCFGVALDGGGEGISRETLAKALELNLFGAETDGFSLGLFGNSLILSDSVPAADLAAEEFAMRLLALSRKIAAISERLQGTDGGGQNVEHEAVFSALDDRFIQV